MKKVILCLAFLAVAACTTPKTVLRNPQTGQVAMCGGSATGSMVGGVVGYPIQKSNDADCVASYVEQGLMHVSHRVAAAEETPKPLNVRPVH